MSAGRPNLPLALHVLNGNPSKLNLEEKLQREPKPQQKIPYKPEWLSEEASREWERIVPELSRLGLLTIIDGAALVGYCQSWARYVEAEKKVTEQGLTLKTRSGYKQIIPEVSIAQKYLQICKSFLVEFGLTPSSRSRISVSEIEEEDDPIAEILRRKQG